MKTKDGLRNWFRGKKVPQGSQGIVQNVMAQERCMYGILKKGERRYIDE
jgi:hypothetical protein